MAATRDLDDPAQLPAAISGTWLLASMLAAVAAFAPWMWATIPSFVLSMLLFGTALSMLAHRLANITLRLRAVERHLSAKLWLDDTDYRRP